MTRQAKIEAAAHLAIQNEMIHPTEFEALVASSLRELEANGSVYICGETVRISRKEQDAIQGLRIQRMSNEQFERFAKGM